MTLDKCQRIESRPGHMVIKFSRGKRCEEISCEETCGCHYDNRTFEFGETFTLGCETCRCTHEGVVDCECAKAVGRKEIRDMSMDEMKRYQAAIRRLATGTSVPSKWYSITDLYYKHKPQAVGSNAFLPWHRYFLWYVEKELKEVDCSVSVPYYDWTMDVGAPSKSVIWAANMFGGNGNDIEGCVQYHPFKNFHPPHWVPCLRRRFNTNVSLPDAIDVHLVLRDPSYENFRLQMEVMLTLFQSWVGGHLASDMSPYDPIFFSVIANIDRLWNNWQLRHPGGLLNYPPKERYIPMAPFDVRPDDVMDGGWWLCSSYYPLTEGTLCNVTHSKYELFHFQYVNGYDRHGFDEEGYDKDGYNIHGLDRNGRIDTRGIYNTHGFDRYGYGRDGYDMMGLDKHWYNIDSYNLDGFDSDGYDRRGFNRYGFNRSGITPYGFHRNGTWLVDKIPDLFDRYGYDRYGYNSYGFDRQGYDRFGFNSKGLDRHMCNSFFLGPMYMIVKRWTDMQLENLDDMSIRIITRVCPAVTKFPPWRYTTNWLSRGDQIPLIETIDGRRVSEGSGGELNVLEDKIWLPTSPDQR